jgi:hypothetical protein
MGSLGSSSQPDGQGEPDCLVPSQHVVELHEGRRSSKAGTSRSAASHVILHERPDRVMELLRGFLPDERRRDV